MLAKSIWLTSMVEGSGRCERKDLGMETGLDV